MIIRTAAFMSCVLLACVAALADDAAAPLKRKIAIAAPDDKAVEVKAQAVQVTAVQTQTLQKLAEVQKEAMQKLTDATKEVAEQAKRLEEATKELDDAQDDEAKAAATKKVDEAKQKLAEAQQKQVAAQQEAQKAAIAAAQWQQLQSYANVVVRENVDPQDPIERFVMLIPGGPVVVEVAMTIDNKPFRTLRETLIDEMLVAADANKDGKATWEEALDAPRFTLGRFRAANVEQRKQYLDLFDKNKDTLVDRSEVRFFMAALMRSPEFMLTGYGYVGAFMATANNGGGQGVYRQPGQTDVQALLDEDHDGVLSEKEIAAAGERLKSRDADDNDLLYENELRVNPTGDPNQQVVRTSPRVQPVQIAMLLGPTVNADALFTALQTQYKSKTGNVAADSFPAVPGLFETLDKDQDGGLSKEEVVALNDIKPHLELTLDLATAEGAKGLAVKSMAVDVGQASGAGESVAVEIPGVKLSVVANLGAAQKYDYAPSANSILTNFDKDTNGYLEKKELPDSYAPQFELWDVDADGKVYGKEIIESYTRMQAPQMTQINCRASTQGNSLFQALDQSGDQRLSLREMRTAHERIKTFDDNQDGQIAQTEIPVTIAVHFSLGNAAFRNFSAAPGAANNAPAKGNGPDWFTRMDRNGDGDVTLKEFLGSQEAFEKIDTNRDGFIEPKEAAAASEASK